MTEVQRGPAAGDWRSVAGSVVITVEVDGEAALLGMGEEHADDLTAMSHQAYGPRIGLPRILQLLGQHRIQGTFFVPGSIAERWPKSLEAIVLAGHEVALHGHSHRPLRSLTADEQRADFEQGYAALRRSGVTPVGYRAPFSQLTRHTLDIVAGSDLIYDASLMDDDKPYRIRTGTGELAELPGHWTLDDYTYYGTGEIEVPHQVVDIWKAELDALRATGSLLVLTLHDFLSGRPSRVRALESFIAYARESDVRFARADRVAEIVMGRTPTAAR